jgi:hypothetical protein
MRRVLLLGAAVAAFGLEVTIAQAGPRIAHATSGAPDLASGGKRDLSSARKSKKQKATKTQAAARPAAAARSGRNVVSGDDRREESGSGM